MKRVAVFGKPGGGKSTLSRKLSSAAEIDLFALDLIEYQQNGERFPPGIYLERHAELIAKESWIIDGLGPLRSFWSRLDAADTLVYVDLPYPVHYWWATKRLLMSIFTKPEGWPEGSSVWKGTIASWKLLRLSPKFWTEELFEEIVSRNEGKTIHRIKTVSELNRFVGELSFDSVPNP